SSDVLRIFTAADILASHADDDNFKAVIESLTRVMRLAQKAPADLATAKVDPQLFENDSEGALDQGVAQVATAANQGLNDLYTALADIQPTIAAYFEATMVMDQNDAVRNN